MAEKFFNIKSADFDSGAGAKSLLFPVNARISLQGERNADSTGVDQFQTHQRLTRRKATIQISFNSRDDLEEFQQNQFGKEGTLTVTAPDTALADRKATIKNALCTEVLGDVQHAEFGSHIATFETVSLGGSTNPIVWAAP